MLSYSRNMLWVQEGRPTLCQALGYALLYGTDCEVCYGERSRYKLTDSVSPVRYLPSRFQFVVDCAL